MKLGDTVKAVGLAALILALNLLVTTLAIAAYEIATNRGGPQGAPVDLAGATRIANWSAPIGGAGLFFLALTVLGRRRIERNPWTFAARGWVAYMILDVASGLAMDARATMGAWPVLSVSLAAALAGALTGAAVARPGPPIVMA